MTDPVVIDPRVARYASIDPTKFTEKCANELDELAALFARYGQLKTSSPTVDANEDLIDYKGDNHTNPAMNGNSSRIEWASFEWARVRHLAKHPELMNSVDLPPDVLKEIIEEGRTIYGKYTDLMSLTNVSVVVQQNGKGPER